LRMAEPKREGVIADIGVISGMASTDAGPAR
jgi:hypothetical protein